MTEESSCRELVVLPFQTLLPGMFLFATLSTWWAPVIARQTQRIHIALTWILTAHYFYVLGLNHLAADQVIGAFVAVSVVSASCVTKRETFCYAVFVMALTLALLDPEGDVGRWTLVCGLLTVLVISFVANHDRLRMIGSLRESKESLREADAKKLDILNSIFDGFAILDSEYRIIYVIPVAIISARAQVLKHRAESGSYSRDDVLKIADSIEQTASRIERIIKALRNVARDGEQDPIEQVLIDEVASHALEVCRERFRHHGVRLFTPNIPADMYLDCRPVQISQVLLNLLANAFDAVSEYKDGWVSLEIVDLGSKIQICVTDRGIGISPEAQVKMFEPFFTTKEVGKGTGLGLSISRSIVESHGGRLFYQLHEGHTRFVVELPKFSCMSVQLAA